MNRMASNFGGGLARCPDPEIAREGLSACIVMLESSLSSSPDDPQLLAAAAGLYDFYGTHLVEDEGVARRVTQRALDYMMAAIAADVPELGAARSLRFSELQAVLEATGKQDVPSLYSLGSVWLDWIRVRADDIDAIADLPIIEAIMTRVTELEPRYMDGSPHMFLALLAALLPDDDEVVEGHFRRAVELAGTDNLLPSVLYAEWLRDSGEATRGDQMLRDVVARGLPASKDHALVNELALEAAREALAESGTASVPVEP
jgi:hypothetical protein